MSIGGRSSTPPVVVGSSVVLPVVVGPSEVEVLSPEVVAVGSLVVVVVPVSSVVVPSEVESSSVVPSLSVEVALAEADAEAVVSVVVDEADPSSPAQAVTRSAARRGR